ncbi:MAG: type 1 glutamine amidotransferase, partial [Abitibacteriaceae bacterium]|nr:type 1 glutamine amidotransferase [Abditibacteriaceae bacterium]
MRIHSFQHVPFEGLASIEAWATSRGHTLSASKFYNSEPLPQIEEIDWLIVMGGPMNIYEENKYPWLVPEKHFIKQAIDRQKPVLGICLGAQLIADVLGAKVTRNPSVEIGWFPIQLTAAALNSPLFSFLPSQFPVLHWHGDTF